MVRTHPQFILLQVKEERQDAWFLAIVYDRPVHGLHNRLWNNLSRDNIQMNEPWLVAGDFNAVTSHMEVKPNSNFSGDLQF